MYAYTPMDDAPARAVVGLSGGSINETREPLQNLGLHVYIDVCPSLFGDYLG